MPTAVIEKLHNVIKYIGTDPVAYELPIARVVKTKLEEDFDIQFP